MKAGKVRRCAAGGSAYALEWDGAQRQLRYRDPVPQPQPQARRTGRPPDPQVTERRRQVAALHEEGLDAHAAAAQIGVPVSTVRADASKLGIRFGRKVKAPAAERSETPDARRDRQAKTRRGKARDRRRFKTGVPATGAASRVAAAEAEGTIYPHTLRDPGADQTVLKDGAYNAKIGGDVLVGWLKGAPIVTLTLEERATCPASCAHWRTCYGNAMDKAHRFRHGPELMDRLRAEIDDLMARHDRLLVRLHVLGDFWSVAYVDFWRDMLFRHSGLHVFGFTAWPAASEIGARLAALRGALPARFWMRHSGVCGPWGSFTIDWPTERKTLGDAIVCPAQLDANAGGESAVHCGSCGACWSTGRPIVFIEH